MSVKLVLRLIMALVFATLAVIFSELIPPIEGINLGILKILVTTAAGLIGFALFPDLASKVTTITISLFNLVLHKIISEMTSQVMRISRPAHHPALSHTPQIGGVAITRPLILDTSAIIDGRILDIAKTGFISGLILIPNFVLLELQQVADSADAQKRTRGRRGFEIVADLKKVSKIKVDVWDKDAGGKAVDDKLLKLAKALNGKIVTTDFNLNKLAEAHGIGVLNVNDLANAVKTIAIPGEHLNLKIVHLGKDPTQGVGYLPDGTMIVVKDGAKEVGKTLDVEVTKSLQIPAGRMIFAERA